MNLEFDKPIGPPDDKPVRPFTEQRRPGRARALLGVFVVLGLVVIGFAGEFGPGMEGARKYLDQTLWWDEKTGAGSLEQADDTHLRTFDLQIENSARIKNVTDESTLETPETGYALLYTYWDGAELHLRALLANNQIAECRILDTSTASDCKSAWAAAYPDRFIFVPRDENGVNYLVSTRQG